MVNAYYIYTIYILYRTESLCRLAKTILKENYFELGY